MPQVIESILTGKMVTKETEADRPDSNYVRFFNSSLAPSSMDAFTTKEKRLIAVLAQVRRCSPEAQHDVEAACHVPPASRLLPPTSCLVPRASYLVYC